MNLPESYFSADIRIAVVTGEPSGDLLGQGLVEQLKVQFPNACFVGVAGPNMQAAGVHSLYPMARLSVMGFLEPLKRARELLTLRKRLAQLFIEHPPHVFIGIDAPDFNLSLEKKLKKANVPVVHYVSPTVWAWRPGRIHHIKQAVDHMLLIFPFEKAIYDAHNINSSYVGHSLANAIEHQVDKADHKKGLGLDPTKPVIAFLPGSRESELKRLSQDYFKTAQCLKRQNPECQLVVAILNEPLKQLWLSLQKAWPGVSLDIRVNQTRDVLKAANCAMVTSGTATLEAALCKTPHIVVYRTGRLTYQLAKRLIKTPYIAMTNILAQKPLVTEYIQNKINPELMATELLTLLQDKAQSLEFYQLHDSLNLNANEIGAHAVTSYIRRGQDANHCRG